MTDFPDSARESLLTLPPYSHNLPWLRARYGLLLSRALDLCDINVQDDSIIRYSVDYYDHFGTPVNKFYSLYYLGCVHENRGDRQSAMEAFVKAESLLTDRVPLRFRCALEMHIGVIYSRIYENQQAIQAFNKAADYAAQCQWSENYYQALLNLVRVYINDGNNEKADRILRQLSSEENRMDTATFLSLKGCEIRLKGINNAPSEEIIAFVDSLLFLYQGEERLMPWEDISRVSIRSGQPETAKRAIQEYANYTNTESSSVYYGILSEVLDSLGDVRGSLLAYKRYIEISDSLDLIIFNQDTKFLKERYALQKRMTQRRVLFLAIVLISLMIIGGLLFLLIRRRRINIHLKGQYDDLLEEYNDLRAFPSKVEHLNKEATELLGNRVNALASFFSTEKPSSLSIIVPQLDSLTADRQRLLETIGLLMAVYRPDFILQLVGKGMTPSECGYCCLIALGLRNGEVGSVINREGVNNINSALRKKLGLEPNSKKLGTILKEMLDDSETR